MSVRARSVTSPEITGYQEQPDVAMPNKLEVHLSDHALSPEDSPPTARRPRPRPRTAAVMGRRGQRSKKRGLGERRRGHKEKKEGVTVKRMWSGGKRRWDKKHYCVFCRRPQVKIARHLLRKHADQQEVMAASSLPTGSKQRHLLLEHLRCRGNYLHNIEVIRQGSGEIVPCRQPSEEVDVRNYLPCPLCLGFFLRSDLWKHQASCRKKLKSDPCAVPGSTSEPTRDSNTDCCDLAEETSKEEKPAEPSEDSARWTRTFEKLYSGVVGDQTDPDRPRKRSRVQAAASRLLPISSGASESCSEILHRMNQDHISHQVKSDWLICKYGNKLMGNENGCQKRYDYVSQKLRELGRFLLAARSLDSDVQNLQDVLAPGRLNLALAAARKASGYRWTRPPLALKTTLKTVCEIAIGESLQDGDWEAAAKTTDFYHMLGREWDNLLDPEPDSVNPEGGAEMKKRPIQSKNERNHQELVQEPVPRPQVSRKVRRRPWSSDEREAVWRQLGVHVLVQSVPGKEVCQRCLDLEPVLRGRHWKDIKNQVHNQIQSQKKHQFHAQMDLQENHQHQQQEPPDQSQRNQLQHHHARLDHNQNQNHNKQQYQAKLDHQDQEHPQIHKKTVCYAGLDSRNQVQVNKKHLYQTDQPVTLDQDSLLTSSPFEPGGSHRAPGHSHVEQDPVISPYPLPHRAPGPHMDQLLSRTDWTDESLEQNYPAISQLSRTLVQDAPPGGQLSF
ncbi:uncharacterized protein LOC115058678 isoform X2 [Echeneis naucrates]|uniref:uncharacterized protein LOC115058678 isoform X2 n=1 Tax=Echeneis naucrates TaxID=173247 RepID=UPI0011132FC9|nr:uncharacterized protein LOC115058678 isoform X2 [Echeneis naucrates]